MSFKDPLVLKYDQKRACYLVTQGRETFYDYENRLYEFSTPAEAVEWALKELDKVLFIEENGKLVRLGVDGQPVDGRTPISESETNGIRKPNVTSEPEEPSNPFSFSEPNQTSKPNQISAQLELPL